MVPSVLSVLKLQPFRVPLRLRDAAAQAQTGAVTAEALEGLQAFVMDLGRLRQSLERIAARTDTEPASGPATVTSSSALGLDVVGTFATLSSIEEVNTIATSFSPREPSFTGASTSSPTAAGVYDGAQGDDTLTFTALDSGIVGTPVLPLRIEIRDGGGGLVDTLDFAGVSPGTPLSASNGLTLALSSGTVAAGDSFSVDVSSSVGSSVNPDKPFDGSGDEDPEFDTGQSVGAGSFDVNGETISIAADDTLTDVLDRITASAAGVTASFDAGSELVVLTQTTLGSGQDIVLENDTSGFLGAVKLGAATLIPGLDPDDVVPVDQVAALSGISTGSFSINGQSFDVTVATDSLDDVLEAINASGAGATASLSGDRVTVRAFGAGSLVLADGDSGFFSAIGIAPGTYPSGQPGIQLRDPEGLRRSLRDAGVELKRLFDDPVVDPELAEALRTRLRDDLAAAVKHLGDATGVDDFSVRLDLSRPDHGELAVSRTRFLQAAGAIDPDELLEFLFAESETRPGLIPALVSALEELSRELAEGASEPGQLLDLAG